MLKNPILSKAQAEVDKQVQDRASYDKIVRAGLKAIYSKGTFGKLTQELVKAEDPVADVARGMVAIISMLSRQARGTMPPVATVQAGMALLLDALDFMEQSGMVKISEQVLEKAITEFMEALMPALGINQGRMDELLGQVQETMANPERRAAYEQHLGQQKGGA